jgi:hypothetical protein
VFIRGVPIIHNSRRSFPPLRLTGQIGQEYMTHDKHYLKAEIDSLRAELTNAGLEDVALDTAANFLRNIGGSPVNDISAIIGIYACLGFASGQLGDVERLNRFVIQYA